MTRTSTVVLAVLAGAGLLAGCTSGGGASTASPTSVGSAPSATPSTPAATGSAVTSPVATTSPVPTSGAPAPGTGCAADGTGIPAGAVSGPTVDVDGDGRADSAWLQQNADGSQLVGITTASGATFGAPYRSASPIDRKVLVADVTGTGTFAAIVSDGRVASLFSVVGCSLAPTLNPQGDQYTFDLGFGNAGTGVGCSDVAGSAGRGLVGLKLNRNGAGAPVSVTRTAVVVDGATAHNGVSDTVDVSGDPTGPAATTAGEITCGDLTMAANGIG